MPVGNKRSHILNPSHKMVKHSQTIRQQIADELFESVWPFCEIGAERANIEHTLSRVFNAIDSRQWKKKQITWSN